MTQDIKALVEELRENAVERECELMLYTASLLNRAADALERQPAAGASLTVEMVEAATIELDSICYGALKDYLPDLHRLIDAVREQLGQQAAAPGVEQDVLRGAAINLNVVIDKMWNDHERYTLARREHHAIRICAAQADLRDALVVAPPPIPMVLFCPRCHAQHVDAADPANGWDNPPPLRSGVADAPYCSPSSGILGTGNEG